MKSTYCHRHKHGNVRKLPSIMVEGNDDNMPKQQRASGLILWKPVVV